MDVLNQIKENMESFSKSKKKIAVYILNYFDSVAFMTATKLSGIINVSESTIVRFTFDLGFKSYYDFQNELQKFAENKLTVKQRLQATENLIEEKDILRKSLLYDINKIKKTLCEIDEGDFNSSVELITKSNKIYIIATRSLVSIANFLHFYLKMMFNQVIFIDSSSLEVAYEEIIDACADDVVIGLTFPRYTNSTLNGIKYLKKIGAKIIVITDSPKSPVYDYADFKLICDSTMTSFIDSLISPFSVINALLTAIAHKKSVNLEDRLNKLENIWNENEVYNTDIL